jgi:hypothetical protein
MKPDFNNAFIRCVIKGFSIKHTLIVWNLLQINKRHSFVF